MFLVDDGSDEEGCNLANWNEDDDGDEEIMTCPPSKCLFCESFFQTGQKVRAVSLHTFVLTVVLREAQRSLSLWLVFVMEKGWLSEDLRGRAFILTLMLFMFKFIILFIL